VFFKKYVIIERNTILSATLFCWWIKVENTSVSIQIAIRLLNSKENPTFSRPSQATGAELYAAKMLFYSVTFARHPKTYFKSERNWRHEESGNERSSSKSNYSITLSARQTTFQTALTHSGDSRMKKVGDHCGAKEKVGGGNINVYLAWWFFIVLKIKLLWLTLSNAT